MKKLIFLCVSVLFLSNAYSQEVRLVNLNYSLLELNPSFAGSNGHFRAQVINRSEGTLLNPKNGVSYGSIDGYVKKLRGGLGVSLSDETVADGANKRTRANLVYAPYFRCPKSGLTVIPSIQLSYVQNLVDANGSSIGPPGAIIIPGRGDARLYQKKNFDGRAGLLVNYKGLYVGMTASSLSELEIGSFGINRFSVRYSAHASYNFLVGANTQINIQTIYTNQAYEKLQLGANLLLYKHIIFGGGYSFDDVWYTSFGYRHNLFTLSLSYDQTTSRRYAGLESYELCASFNLRTKENRKIIGNFESW